MADNMNIIDKQTNILNDMCQILNDEANSDYDSISCGFQIIEADGDVTASTSLEVVRNSKIIRNSISDENIFTIVDKVIELRSVMTAYTGGKWNSFILTIDENGQANVKFDYMDSDNPNK